MKVGDVASASVVVVKRSQTLRQAAHLMAETHLGCLVLIDDDPLRPRPVGVVTDRDLVVRVFAEDLEGHVDALTVGDLAVRSPITATADEPVESVLQRLSQSGVRRCPVVDADDGALVGIFSVDDALFVMAREALQLGRALDDMARLVPREAAHEAWLQS